MAGNTWRKKNELGFSITELVIVVLIISIIAVLALPQIIASRRVFRFAGVQRQVVTAFREARQEAIGQRVPIKIRYDNSSRTINISGGTLGPAGDSRNRISELTGNGLAHDDLVYGRPTGVPGTALGDGTNITSLTADIIEITFQSDGSVLDASDNPQNNALFFYNSQSPGDSGFAVSILGAGGRVKLWNYSSAANAYVE